MTGWWKALFFAAVGVGLAAEATAATVSVTRVERPRPGVVRIGLRYATKDRPRFRLVPVCRSSPAANWLVASSVRIVPRKRQATLETGDDFAWIIDRSAPCRPTGLAVEVVEGRSVVASAGVPLALTAPRTFVVPPAPSPPRPTASRLGVVGQKDRAPQTRMSQASVTWSLSDRLLFHLSYERTAFAPTMSKDHDDGVLTGVKLRF